MESSSLVSDFLSPESTITSLLSSSGHLRSSLLIPEHSGTFSYNDKSYDSASAALDAYIADFERSHWNRKPLTGRLVLPDSPASTPRRPRVSTLRNRDVLREHLTERELDFLNLPVSSLHHSVNRDRLSMTTDELLAVPHDGSMPVTHTSAFLQGLLSHSEVSQPCPSSRPAGRNWDRLSSNDVVPQLTHHHPQPARRSTSSRCRERPRTAMLKPEADISSVHCYGSSHRAARLERPDLSSSLHLPHWLTSNKTDMDCSGLTSVPHLNYPAWIQHRGPSKHPPPTESEPCADHVLVPLASPRPSAPSWVAELEDDSDPILNTQHDNQQTLKGLRLQFAEQISLLAAERKSSDLVEKFFRDNKIESLIQKADQVLNSLSQSCVEARCPADPANTRTQLKAQDHAGVAAEEVVSPVNAEESLLRFSSGCHPVTLESAAAAGGITAGLADRGPQAQSGCGYHADSINKQPGPAEAMKQMLFRLQAVEAELQKQQWSSEAPTLTDRPQAEETPVKQRPEAEAELESFPSLQRALHHLSRLKVLVEEPRENHRGEEEEKDDDEGHYSSSSTEGLVSAHQNAS